ncbi:MAG TPA: hypothetical protein VJ787_14150, partial [Thermoleophilia bacterium]|nr:hypothetical protein [Thermoleophilia bacterium]
LLDVSPAGVPATFKTVVKGSTIETIPCTILGVVPGSAYDNGPLIMFQATGPVIEATGGIAAGMSGSPVYVDDGGAQKLAGAVAYGSDFTTNGFGLATPIESMQAVEATLTPSGAGPVRVALADPVHVGDQAIDHLLITRSHSAATRFMARPGTLVMSPRGLLEVSGLPGNSRVFKQLQHVMAERGVDVMAARVGAATQSDFTTDLVPGASVAALQSRGDVWCGGIGTVTYTSPEGNLVAFGHPMVWDGPVAYYMANADVVGTWSSGWESFKVAVPGAVRGTITRDYGAGVAGPIGTAPQEASVTSTATDGDTGRTATVTSYLPTWIIDNYSYSGIGAYLAYPALYQASGDAWFEGTVRYTVTMQVDDGAHSYTVTRSNTWNDDWDAASWAIEDVWTLFDRLLADRDGLATAHITSFDMVSTLTRRHDRARIADVKVPGGLKVGKNIAQVTLWQYGDATPRSLDVPFTVPKGMSRQGWLYVSASESDVYMYGDYFYDFEDWGGVPPARQTLAEVVADIAKLPTNEDLQLLFEPDEAAGGGSQEATAQQASGAHLQGFIEKRTSEQELFAAPAPYRGVTVVRGFLDRCSGATTVKIHRRAIGSNTRVFVGTARVRRLGGSGPWSFSFPVGPLLRTTEVTTVWDGDDNFVGSTGRYRVPVAARVRLAPTLTADGGVRLIATVWPHQTGHPLVAFQRKDGDSFVPIGSARVGSRSQAALTWRPGHGTWIVRAVFRGSATNTAATSPVRAITLP